MEPTLGVRKDREDLRFPLRNSLTGLLTRREIGERVLELATRFSLAVVYVDTMRGSNEVAHTIEGVDFDPLTVLDLLREAFGVRNVAQWSREEFLVIAPDSLPPAIAMTLKAHWEHFRSDLALADRQITFYFGVQACDDGDWEAARLRPHETVKEMKDWHQS